MILDVLVILDRSGSMQAARSDHEGGLRSFVEDQRKQQGDDVRFTLVQFDDVNPCDIVYDRAPLALVTELKLVPRGNTPLLDAVGKALAHLEAKNPESVVCLIITDGQENASREWTRDRVKARIEELTKDRRYTMLYLGANVDAFAEARAMGIGVNTAMAFTNNSVGVGAIYASASSNYAQMRAKTRAGRQRGLTGQAAAQSASVVMDWSEQDRSSAVSPDNNATTTTNTTTTKETK